MERWKPSLTSQLQPNEWTEKGGRGAEDEQYWDLHLGCVIKDAFLYSSDISNLQEEACNHLV